MRACPTRPFGSWAFLASPCAVLRFSQVSLALLMCLQVYLSCSQRFGCVCIMHAVCVSGQCSNPSVSSRHNPVLPRGELGMPLCWACTDAFPSVSSRICVHCNTMRICVYVQRACTASLFFFLALALLTIYLLVYLHRGLCMHDANDHEDSGVMCTSRHQHPSHTYAHWSIFFLFFFRFF